MVKDRPIAVDPPMVIPALPRLRHGLLTAALLLTAVLPGTASATTLYPRVIDAPVSGVSGVSSALTVRPDGRPVIVHLQVSGSAYSLRAVDCADPACASGTESVSQVAVSTGLFGMGVSMATRADGNPLLIVQDQLADRLHAIACNDPACQGGDEASAVILTSTNLGVGSTVAIPADGLPVIAYGHLDDDDLLVVKCNDAGCQGGDETLSTVDAVSQATSTPSITIGQNGLPVIAYYDATGGDLKLARCNDAACAGGDETLITLDSTADVGKTPSLRIGPGGGPVVAYYDDTTDDLKVIRCDTATCASSRTITTVDATGTVGSTPTMAIAASGNPVIAYRDGTPDELALAECNDPACTGGDETISVVDTTGTGVGLSPWLALGADGTPVISYGVSGGGFRLRVAAVNARATTTAGTVDMGSAAVTAAPATRTLTVTSSGTTPVVLGTPAITGPDAGVFSVTGGTCAGQNVAPGATCTVEIAFDPSAAGTFTATLTLPGDDPTGPLTRALTGAGTVAAPPGADPPATSPDPPAANPGPAPATPAPALTALTAAKRVLTVRATDATTAALVIASPRPTGAALTRALTACAKRRGAARTRCTDAARWRTIRRASVTLTAGTGTLRLGKVAGRHRVTVTLTGPGGTATATRTLRIR